MKYIKVFENFDEIDFKDIRNLKPTEHTNDDFKNVIEILERDCKPFLDEIISNYKPDYPGIIFRGSRPSYRLEIYLFIDGSSVKSKRSGNPPHFRYSKKRSSLNDLLLSS